MARSLTECIGTFFLVLVIGLVVTADAPFAALAIGTTLAVMVYMGGHVSGGHYNPAVTLAVWMRGRCTTGDVLPYVIAQVGGAFAAGFAVYALTGKTFAPAPGDGVSMEAALAVEALFTFALCLVVLNSATAPKTDGNSFYGLAIGLTVFVGATAGGAISGGAFNPAVGVGAVLARGVLGGGAMGHVWLYVVGPLVGGALAAIVYRLQNPEVEAPPALVPAARVPGVKAGDFSVPKPGEGVGRR